VKYSLKVLFGAVALGIWASVASGATVDVFFADGQSNAKPMWAQGIRDSLASSGAYQNVLVVDTMHSGNWLSNWWITGPQTNYQADFFDPSGTGLLQQQLQSITAAGDSYRFAGLFWFQGEGDSADAFSTSIYSSRFMSMLSQLSTDLGSVGAPINFDLALIDYNPAYTTLPANASVPAHVDAFRQMQIDLATANNGAYFDTRGYARTDLWHLTGAELYTVGQQMGAQFASTFAAPVPVPSSLLLLSTALIGPLLASGIHRRSSD